MAPYPVTSPARTWIVVPVVLLSGFSTMALQMSAVRVLAPFVGATILVWATTIGLSLLAMTIGYLLGGWLSVRLGAAQVLTITLTIAALLTGLVPTLRGLVDDHLTLGITDASWASVVGAAVGFIAMFAAPAVLLGVTPPYAMHLVIHDVAHSGRAAGRLYAVSTVGSILGTLLPGLLLLQWIGSARTLYVVAALLVLAAALALVYPPLVDPPLVDPSLAEQVSTRAAPRLNPLIAAIVVTEGIATMATEISTSRLVAPFFGSSHAVWAVLVAIALGAIALGSFLGGRAADRWPTRSSLALLLWVAASAVVALPFAVRPLLLVSVGSIDDVDVPRLVSTFLGSMLLAGVPMTLLGMVPPWALRLALERSDGRSDAEHDGAGGIASRLYALSTGGALVGTFASAIWLIPWLGTRRTLALAAVLVVVVALALGRSQYRWARVGGVVALAMVLAAVVVRPGLVKPSDDVVLAERESRYQFVQVLERPSGRRVLQMNEGWAVHSVYDPGKALTGGYWDAFLALPDLVGTAGESPESSAKAPGLLVLGNAGGTVPRMYRGYWPEIAVDGVELDPVVTELGERWLDSAGRNLTITTADARPYLAHAGDRDWDIVVVDTYRQPYIPFYLATKEFFASVRDHLAPGGVLAINVSRTPGSGPGNGSGDTRLEDHLARTLHDVFGYVGRYRSGDYNDVLVAADTAPDVARAKADPNLPAPVRSDLATFQDVPLDDRVAVLTDDKAPVEWMTDLMIFGQAH